MNPERWRQIDELLQSALRLPSGGRTAFLRQACNGDAALEHEVQSLLAAQGEIDGFLDRPALELAAEEMARGDPAQLLAFDAQPGQSIGPYRLIELLGAGGMGEVWRAEQSEPIRRAVALKLIKPGMDTRAVVARFDSERQALAMMDHTNIAKVFDAGATPAGRPFFVMELVPGVPITDYCDEHRLTIKQRLLLFLQVCDGVQHAHQKAIIHRDLKPSNILVEEVDGKPVPKIIDFGLAKAITHDGGARSMFTELGMMIGTPSYMSPEQAGSQDATIDTRTDVYSLGVVLFELLVGAPPFSSKDIRGSGAEPTLRQIREAEAPRPSVKFAALGSATQDAASARGEKAAFQLRQLRGDLDWITLKTIEKDRARRYSSVSELAADIRRHLSDQPVLAGPPSATYRARKFVRRHRGGVAAGSLAALTMIAGIITTTFEARRARVQEQLAKEAQAKAERRFNEVRKLAHSVLFDYHDAIKNLPGATPVRERLVRDSLQYLDGLAGEVTSDRSLLRELASAYERVADVQGGTLEANLGNTVGAIESGKKALHIRVLLLASDPKNADLKRELASSYFKIGTLLWETGDMSGAADYLRQAVRLREDLAKAAPADLERQHELSAAYDRMGMLLLDQGDAATALTHFRRSLGIVSSVPDAEQGRESTRRSISVEYEHIGSALLELDDLPGALENNGRALSLRAALSKDFPLNVDHQRTLQVSYYNQGEILARIGRTQAALDSYREQVRIGEKLSRADPQNEQYRGDLAYGLIRVGDMRFKLARYPEALASYKLSQDLRSADVKADPANLWKRSSLIEVKAKLCRTLVAAHASGDAHESCSGALSLMQSTALDPGNAAIRSFFADTYSDLAAAEAALAASARISADERQQHWRSARKLYVQSLGIWQELQTRNILARADRGKKDAVLQKIAECDAALH
jgi:serine/threonine protein kinase/tetratricopeptide (TPR) repeat protein